MGTDFPLSEFTRVSHRGLSAVELAKVDVWREILQPARDRFGPLALTSFVRVTDPDTSGLERGAHATGDAVDLAPVRVGVAMKDVADFFARRYLREHGGDGQLRQVINERDHVHLARVLVQGARAGYLDETPSGQYLAATPAPGAGSPDMRNGLLSIGLVAFVGLLFLAD